MARQWWVEAETVASGATYTFTDKLPSYVDSEGKTVYAQLSERSKSAGWVDNGDGTATLATTVNNDSVQKPIYLAFPKAKIGSVMVNTATGSAELMNGADSTGQSSASVELRVVPPYDLSKITKGATKNMTPTGVQYTPLLMARTQWQAHINQPLPPKGEVSDAAFTESSKNFDARWYLSAVDLNAGDTLVLTRADGTSLTYTAARQEFKHAINTAANAINDAACQEILANGAASRGVKNSDVEFVSATIKPAKALINKRKSVSWRRTYFYFRFKNVDQVVAGDSTYGAANLGPRLKNTAIVTGTASRGAQHIAFTRQTSSSAMLKPVAYHLGLSKSCRGRAVSSDGALAAGSELQCFVTSRLDLSGPAGTLYKNLTVVDLLPRSLDFSRVNYAQVEGALAINGNTAKSSE